MILIDSHITDTTTLGKGIYLFSVFDGHGGNEIADYLRDHFCSALKANPNFKKKNYELALVQTFKEIDISLITSEINEKLKEISHAPKGSWEDSKCANVAQAIGWTACMALITPTEIFVANLGDSRWVISKGGKPYEMSVDHKPNLSSEKKRIKAAGGFVEDNRVKGMLNLSRSFGDHLYKSDPSLSYKKQMVICVPEIWVQERNKDVDFLFIAWDGIWEWLGSDEVVTFIQDKMKKYSKSKKKSTDSKMSQIVESLFEKIIARDVITSSKSNINHLLDGKGCDNMTGILVTIN